jgi:hypothetical protein
VWLLSEGTETGSGRCHRHSGGAEDDDDDSGAYNLSSFL